MKTKNLFILGLFSILFLAGNNLQGKDYYMYVNGTKHHYKVSPNKILVHYADNDSTEIKTSLQKLSVKSMKVNNIYHKFALVDLENTSKEKIINIVEQWNISGKGIYVSPVMTGEDGFEMSFIPNQILVRIKQDSDYSLLTQNVQSYHVKAIKLCDFDKKTYLITLSDTHQKNSLQVANELYETGLFDYVEPNIFHFVKRMTNDTHYQQQWALHSNTAGIKAEQAWTITTGNPSIRVAILDSGVDLGHPDLAGNLLQGFNASTGAPNGNVEFRDVQFEHGTACAGIVAAIANNGVGTAGVAYNCRILPIYDGMITNAVATAIDWARQNGASVLSISNTYGETNALNIEISEAATAGRNNLGCVIVAASGNNGTSTVSYPARRSDVISVGAVISNGNKWSYSNYGTNLDVVAPGGAGIYTTDIQGNIGYNTANGAAGDYNASFGGTSAACPHVAGIAALILSVRSDLTQAQVRHAIESTCRKLSGYTYSNNSAHSNGTWNSEVGHGLVNAYEAVYSVAPRITGPDIVCPGSSRTFIAHNFPGSVTWTCSSSKLTLSASGNTVTVTNSITNSQKSPDAGYYGSTDTANNIQRAIPGPLPEDGWIRATVDGTSFSAQKDITVNHHDVTDISWGTMIRVNGYYTCPIRFSTESFTIVDDVTWSVTPSTGYVYSGSGEFGYGYTFRASKIGVYTVTAARSNACGYSSVSENIPTVSAGPIFDDIVFAYPNPAANILNIEIDTQARAQSSAPAVTSGKQLKVDKTYDIRLYDNQGTLLRNAKTKGGKVEFNVANLPDGIYYLHIYDGVNSKPEMRQIVVEH